MRNILILVSICVIFLFGTLAIFAEPRGSYESENFEINNMSAVYQGKFIGDNYDIVGIIKNIGNKTFDHITLISMLYDKNNNLIGVEQAIPILDISGNGSSSPFKFNVLTNSTLFDHFVIQIGGRG